MSRAHHKKRNSGLMYEFLVASISAALVRGDDRTSSRAVKILRRHFKPGTELYKELRLISSLYRTKLSSDAVAGNVLREAKTRARSFDSAALDRQKSLLIKDVNQTLQDPEFYDRHVEGYRVLATLQTLINDWRSDSEDLGRISLYEDQAVKHLVSERVEKPSVEIDSSSVGTGRLLMKTMMTRLNERYSGQMSEDQRALVKAYAFSTATNDPDTLRLRLETVRNSVIEKIDRYVTSNSSSEKLVCEKLTQARAKVLSENIDKPDDEQVVRFMLYSRLTTELTEGQAK